MCINQSIIFRRYLHLSLRLYLPLSHSHPILISIPSHHCRYLDDRFLYGIKANALNATDALIPEEPMYVRTICVRPFSFVRLLLFLVFFFCIAVLCTVLTCILLAVPYYALPCNLMPYPVYRFFSNTLNSFLPPSLLFPLLSSLPPS